MTENQYIGFNKTGVAIAKWHGRNLFICSDGTYIWSNDNLFTAKVLVKEVYRDQIVKRLPGTSFRLSRRSLKKMETVKVNMLL